MLLHRRSAGGEQCLQVLLQMPGRAAVANAGEVIVQTFPRIIPLIRHSDRCRYEPPTSQAKTPAGPPGGPLWLPFSRRCHAAAAHGTAATTTATAGCQPGPSGSGGDWSRGLGSWSDQAPAPVAVAAASLADPAARRQRQPVAITAEADLRSARIAGERSALIPTHWSSKTLIRKEKGNSGQPKTGLQRRRCSRVADHSNPDHNSPHPQRLSSAADRSMRLKSAGCNGQRIPSASGTAPDWQRQAQGSRQRAEAEPELRPEVSLQRQSTSKLMLVALQNNCVSSAANPGCSSIPPKLGGVATVTSAAAWKSPRVQSWSPQLTTPWRVQLQGEVSVLVPAAAPG